MLMLRLKRTGRKNQPSYRVVVSPSGLGGPKAKPIEYLGWLNPLKKTFNLNKERIQYWLSQGARPSATLHNLLVKTGLLQAKKIAVHQKPAPKEPAQEPAKEQPVSAPSQETTAEPVQKSPALESIQPEAAVKPETAPPAQE